MARRALLVGINDYRKIKDLRGSHNDVSNMRSILKDYLGFTNNDIRAVLDDRATKDAILYRLEYMVDKAVPGDFMVFHFSGHGSQIRDRNGDELEDRLDEVLCPWEVSWDSGFILDDELDIIFQQIPHGAVMEVFLDCCHSGTSARSRGSETPALPATDRMSRYLPPPADIRFRHEGEEQELGETRGFQTANRFGTRSTANHILWAACQSGQEASDAFVNGTYNGAFTYYFCKHMRDSSGRISRRNLLERIRNSLFHNGYAQIPQLECMNEAACNGHPLQFVSPEKSASRLLYLTTPYLRGSDVKRLQEALRRAGYSVSTDGVFGPHTHDAVVQWQHAHQMNPDGVAGPAMLEKLL
ncbi:MAG: caspase family protein [Desulfobacterales bacterium]